MIGVQFALADGRLIKAGGNVVKNVAGYDLGKLVSGSFGSLAAIVTATFKLLPMPVAFHTLIATFRASDAAARAAAALNDSQLEPIAAEIHAVHSRQDAPPYRLLVRFAGTRTATASQAEQAPDARWYGRAPYRGIGVCRLAALRRSFRRFGRHHCQDQLASRHVAAGTHSRRRARTSEPDGELIGRAAVGAGAASRRG